MRLATWEELLVSFIDGEPESRICYNLKTELV
jgi:hypothetical protein